MANKANETLYHPSFPEHTVEVEGAERIKAHKDAGWISEPGNAPKTATTEPAPAQKTSK